MERKPWWSTMKPITLSKSLTHWNWLRTSHHTFIFKHFTASAESEKEMHKNVIIITLSFFNRCTLIALVGRRKTKKKKQVPCNDTTAPDLLCKTENYQWSLRCKCDAPNDTYTVIWFVDLIVSTQLSSRDWKIAYSNLIVNLNKTGEE